MAESLECGHEESPHNDITRGYGTDKNGNKVGFAQEESDEPEQDTCPDHRQPLERCPARCRSNIKGRLA